MNEDKKTIAKGAMFVLGGIVISKIITYLWRIFIARYIGQEAYGIFSIALALLGIATIFSVLGFSDGLLRFTSFYRARKKYNEAKGVLISVFSINFISTLSLSFLLVFFAPSFAKYFFHNSNITGPVYIVALALPFFVFGNHFLTLLKSQMRVDYIALTQSIIEGFVKIIGTVVFFYIGYIALAPILGYFIALVGTFFLSMYFLFFKTDYAVILKEKAVYHWRELIIYSLPLMFVFFIASFLTYTDTMMLGYFTDNSITGIYNAALPTANLLSITMIAFSSLFFPLFIEKYSKKQYKEMNLLFKLIVKWIYLSMLPIFYILMFFPEAILIFFFGPQYAQGSIALRILAVGYFIYCITGPTHEVLMTLKKQNLILTIMFSGSMINLILNYLLIPVYGISGAATATSFSLIYINLLSIYYVRKYLKIFPLDINQLNGFFATLFAFIIIYFIVNIIFPTTPLYVLILSLTGYIIIY
ncbi:MAG: flippase, partial [Candidatus Aenigmarchaeota archaeon]|nr:flippase [Candidatus Aenigmarchaeota archaeon]